MSDQPPDLPDVFFLAWVNACSRLKVDPLDLARVAYSESGMRASAHNHNGNAVGLVQFMPTTLAGLGWTQGWDAFSQLAAVDQVPFVERYFRGYSALMKTDALCYLATFLPALLPLVPLEDGDAFVLCAREAEMLPASVPPRLHATLVQAYKWNPAFDVEGKGYITLGDLGARLERVCVGARYQAIVERLRQAQGLPSGPLPDPEPTLPELSCPSLDEDDPKDAA